MSTATSTDAPSTKAEAPSVLTPEELLEKALGSSNEEAVDVLSRALEMKVAETSELHKSTARFYHEYGRVLIESSKSEQDVFAKIESQVQETKDGEDEKQEKAEVIDAVPDRSASASSSPAADAAEEASPKADGTGTAAGEGGEAAPSGKEEAKPVAAEAAADAKSGSELVEARELAWELLETARVIYSKSDGENQLKIAAVHCLLGDVAMEDGNFQRAYQEYVKSTQLYGKVAGIADRRLGSAHQLAGLCALYDQQNEASIFHYTAAAEAFNNTLTELLVGQEIMERPSQETEDIEFVEEALLEKLKEKVGEESPLMAEANDLNGIVNNLIERVEEIQDQIEADAKNPQMQDVIAKLGQKLAEQFVKSQSQGTGFDKPTTAAPCEGAQEINVLVPKKRSAPSQEGTSEENQEPAAKRQCPADNK